MKKAGIGIIGAGYVAQACHIDSFMKLEGCTIAGLAELRPSLGKLVAKKYNIPRVTETHHELLLDESIDAVVVVTRRHATGAIVRDALRAGKAVLSEKPMCHSVAQARDLIQDAQSAQKVYRIGYMKRHDPHVRAARDFLARVRADGSAGELKFVRAYSYAGQSSFDMFDLVMTDEPRPDGIELWRSGPDWLPDGLLDRYDHFVNVHCHIINISRHLVSNTLSVEHFSYNPESTSLASIRFGTVAGSMEFGDRPDAYWHEGLDLIFEKGKLTLQFPPPFAMTTPAVLIWQDADGAESPISADARGGWAFANQAASFVDAVATDDPEISSAEDALGDLEAIESMWRHVDPSNFRSILL